MYDVLAGPQNVDVTKIRYLKALYPLLKGTKVEQTQFIFQLYDKNKDGHLAADEVYSMLISLPEQSPIYDECMK